MSDHILLAFWLPNQKRFCTLISSEIDERNLFDRHCHGFSSAVYSGLIRSEKFDGGTIDRIYSLSDDGEARVKKLLAKGRQFTPNRKLTAIPPGEGRYGNERRIGNERDGG